MVIFLNLHMRAWKSIQPSPILLLAHHTLQFYHLIKIPAQDILAISTPQLPPKRTGAEK